MTDKTIDEILIKYAQDYFMLISRPSFMAKEIADKKRTEATKAITQAMLNALPEKANLSVYPEHGEGYNDAIDDMEAAIKKMGDK